MNILFPTRRFVTSLLFICLADAGVVFGSTMQDVTPVVHDSVSISPSDDLGPDQNDFQNVQASPESTGRKENITAESLPDASLKWHTMFTKIPSDWALFATNTFRSENIPVIAGVIGTTGVLYVVDNNTYSNMHEYEKGSRQFRSFRDALISIGDGKYQFGFVGGFAMYGLIADDSRALKTASQMTEAILATGIVVQVLKRVTGRESPIVATKDRGAVHPFPNLADYERHQPKYYSFPSGHIATTTAGLTVLCENFPEAKWMPPVSCILIGAVGGSLVSKGWHWYSDLPLGIVLGYSFGMIAAHPEGIDINKTNSDKSLNVSVAPKLTLSGAGLNMTFHF